MNLPSNPDFYRKLVLATILIIVAVYFQLTTGAIPTEVITAITSYVMFLLGVGTQAHGDPKPGPYSEE